MPLFFSDFSRVQFSNITGPSLPRRQRVRINGMNGVDRGDEIVLQADGVNCATLTTQLTNRAGAAADELVTTGGYATLGDGGGSEWRYASGVTAGANGYTRINTADGLGQWQMLNPMSGKGIDVRKFGAIPNGTTDCILAIEAAMAWAMSDYGPSGASNIDRPINLYFPIAARSYRISRPIIPPATNHNPLALIGETGSAYTAGAALYSDAFWDSDDCAGGAKIRADSGQDCVLMHNGGVVAGEGYYRLNCYDIVLIARGNGRCVAMTSVLGDNASGRCVFRDTLLLGAKVGWQMNTYEPAVHIGLYVIGCDTGLRVGNAATGDGANTQQFDSCVLLANNNHIDIESSAGLQFYGGLVQGGGTVLKMRSTSTGCRNVLMQFSHWEAYDTLFDIDPAVTESGVTFSYGHMNSGFGLLLPTGPATIYGSGLTFNYVDINGIEFVGPSVGDVLFNSCCYAEYTETSGPNGYNTPYVSARNIVERPRNFTFAGGALALDFVTHGCNITIALNGNVTAVTFTNYPSDRSVNVSFYQNNPGGYTITHGAGVKRNALYSNTGNVAFTRCCNTYQKYVDNNIYMTGFSAWTAD